MSATVISRPIGILPGRYIFQFPPPAVDASASSETLAEGDGAAGEGDVAATAGGGATGVGETCATIIGDFAGVGDGVGVAFLFFLSALVCLAGDAAGGGGVGETAATFGVSTCAAGSTLINSFAAGGGGVGARPATVAGVFGEVCSR